MKFRGLLLSTFLFTSTPFLFGCQIGYLINSGIEQAKILNRRVPIEEALKDKNLSEKTKLKLKLSLEAREFAEKNLNLKPTKNYSSFVDLKRPYVTYIVRAAPQFELKPYLWSFPLVGKVPYKGFFALEEAKKEAKTFDQKQWDTYVRGVSAYSTLGWFNDPILSSMTRYSDHNLVNTIIHETVHATIFIKDNVDFNERLASFIGDLGTELYYLQKEGADSKTVLRIQQENQDAKLFSKFISKEIKDLKKWYKENAGQIDLEKKQNRLKEIQSNFKSQVLPQMKILSYKGFAETQLTNAQLLSYRTYSYDLSDFQKAYEKLGQNFFKFLEFCKSLEKKDNPETYLKEFANKPLSTSR